MDGVGLTRDTGVGSLDEPHKTKRNAFSSRTMLSAIVVLLAVGVILVCLHVYARWYIQRTRRNFLLRRRRRRTHLVFYVEPNNPGSIVAVPTRGLDPSVLRSLPTFTHSVKTHDEGDEAAPPLECAVCLSEFEEGERGRLLPKCNHSFHLDCIDMWLHSHSTCPLCRSPVDADFPASQHGSNPDDVVVEIVESTGTAPAPSSEFCADGRDDERHVSVEESSAPVDLQAPAKRFEFVGVSTDVSRLVESFNNSDELRPGSPSNQQLRSPTNRMLSLKMILSREKRQLLSPSPSSSRIGTSCVAELDVERGRLETQSSQALTPR
ncbi:hypothetical protein Nepgr_010130 [Nepenthes gracilis]|uniref:RING-type E3 ubiquitin transferase n=1 Tax=Nepenthes gracilis TaxID=150966 RepID=A0AAD3SCK2_NEPGR|nr:hypothetical protein Nepgr_010130 [Nepenthes gracilis]